MYNINPSNDQWFPLVYQRQCDMPTASHLKRRNRIFYPLFGIPTCYIHKASQGPVPCPTCQPGIIPIFRNTINIAAQCSKKPVQHRVLSKALKILKKHIPLTPEQLVNDGILTRIQSTIFQLRSTYNYTPEKFNTNNEQNSHISKGDTFSKPSFLLYF